MLMLCDSCIDGLVQDCSNSSALALSHLYVSANNVNIITCHMDGATKLMLP